MVHDTIQSLNCVVEFIYIYTILIVQSDLPFCSSDFFFQNPSSIFRSQKPCRYRGNIYVYPDVLKITGYKEKVQAS